MLYRAMWNICYVRQMQQSDVGENENLHKMQALKRTTSAQLFTRREKWRKPHGDQDIYTSTHVKHSLTERKRFIDRDHTIWLPW